MKYNESWSERGKGKKIFYKQILSEELKESPNRSFRRMLSHIGAKKKTMNNL